MRKQIQISGLFLVLGCLLLVMATPASAQEPPLWLMGKFRAYNRKYNTRVDLTIWDSGKLVAKSSPQRGKRVVQQGTVGDHVLYIENSTYDIERTRFGFVLTQRDDTDNTTEYRRTDDYFERDHPDYDSRIPDWLVGVWRGSNHKYQARVNINIRPSGQLVAVGIFSDGHETVQRGAYSKGKIIIDGETYLILKRTDGLRFQQIDDRDNIIDISRSDSDFGRDPDIDPPPSWLIGTYSGYNRRYDSDVRMEIQSSGKVVSRITKNGKTQIAVGAYRRGRIRIVGGATYDIERAGDGIRLFNINEDGDSDVYRRARDLDRR